MKLTKQRIREIIKEEIETMNEEPVQEGIENITPENIGLVFEAMGKMAPMIALMGVPAFIGLMKEFYDEQMAKKERGDM